MNEELLPQVVSRETSILPSDSHEIDERRSTESLESKIKNIPKDLQENVLNVDLNTRRKTTLHSFLKLYIYRYGLDRGPLLGLPYHPTYPFLTIIELNPIHYRTFPEEAYFLLWYLASLFTIGVFMDTRDLLYYFKKCIGRRRKPRYNYLYKWLTLFHEIAWWEKNIQAQNTQNVYVTFKIVTYQVSQGVNAVKVERRYEAHVKEGYNDPLFNNPTLANLPRMKELLVANGVNELTNCQKLLHNYTEWHDPKTYPLSYILEIQQILTRFVKQYEWSRDNPYHPVYRLLEKRFTVRRYIPGLRYCVEDFSDSAESDPEDDNSYDEAETPFGDNGKEEYCEASLDINGLVLQ